MVWWFYGEDLIVLLLQLRMALCFRLYCIDRSMALWLKLNVMVLHPNAKRCFLIKHTRFIQVSFINFLDFVQV